MSGGHQHRKIDPALLRDSSERGIYEAWRRSSLPSPSVGLLLERLCEEQQITSDLLVDILKRLESAIDRLHSTMRQREDARGMARLPFSAAWTEGNTGMRETLNWLDQAIDQRTPMKEAPHG